MQPLLSSRNVAAARAALKKANTAFARLYPGEPERRQPVHTFYGGAHLFHAEWAKELGEEALELLETYVPESASLMRGLELPVRSSVARRVFSRVVEKLQREPVEDFRIDFEDGYGRRPDDEEDRHAVAAAGEMARAMELDALPPFSGIRIKSFSEELLERSVRTLDLFVSTLLERSGGVLPGNFVVTLPKVTVPEQVPMLVRLLETLESRHGLAQGTLPLELMMETPQSLIDGEGRVQLPALVAAAEGRCVGVHLGVYDYTASLGITAAHQSMAHPLCDFARDVMQVSLAGTGVLMSDGATHVLPVLPHHEGVRPLTAGQKKENREALFRAWRLSCAHTRHSLKRGIYQGWDLHAAQLPVRYAATYAFFLEGLDAASRRLKAFLEAASQATLQGDVFDDAATGQALLGFFLRGLACGAITVEEAQATGLTPAELATRSFPRILEGRKAAAVAQERKRAKGA